MNKHRMNCVFNVCGGLAHRFANAFANGKLRFKNSLVHPRTANFNNLCFMGRVLSRGNVRVGKGAMTVSKFNGIT